MTTRWIIVLIILVHLNKSHCWNTDVVSLAADFFTYKNVKHACYLSCDSPYNNKQLVSVLQRSYIRTSVQLVNRHDIDLSRSLRQWTVPVGVIIDATCQHAQHLLDKASRGLLFDATHVWLVAAGAESWAGGGDHGDDVFIQDTFQNLNLSVDADVTVVSREGRGYCLTDVFNFGKIQGNNLEKNLWGTWSSEGGLNVSVGGYKYYNRWDFHNLTLRAVSVILGRRGRGGARDAAALVDLRYTGGISAMTKVAAQLLEVLRHLHHFRFNLTIADRWIGSPERNSALAVSNSLFWREQDISYTFMRVYPAWLQWVDPFFPPVTTIQTKVYYLITSRGVGEYENRFLRPLSVGAWLAACAAGALCALVVCAGAALERRPQPALHALCSMLAAVGQQAFEDGVQFFGDAFVSQGRRLAVLSACGGTMLLYNYYTSSVVSWLLSAPPPSVDGLQGLIRSDLELVFEDIGYTHGWLDNPGFYYYSGYKNPLEDELRERKVTRARRTVALMMTPEQGMEVIRTGGYAYHTEPYAAWRVSSRRFSERELCALGSVQLMPPAPVYLVGQRRSPYREFFVWSLMRLSERGHAGAWRARVWSAVSEPACSGRVPRALSLGQAAPAFLLLAGAVMLAAVTLLAEIICHRRRAGAETA